MELLSSSPPIYFVCWRSLFWFVLSALSVRVHQFDPSVSETRRDFLVFFLLFRSLQCSVEFRGMGGGEVRWERDRFRVSAVRIPRDHDSSPEDRMSLGSETEAVNRSPLCLPVFFLSRFSVFSSFPFSHFQTLIDFSALEMEATFCFRPGLARSYSFV